MTDHQQQPAYPYPYAGSPSRPDTSAWAIAAFCAAAFATVCQVAAVVAAVPVSRELEASGAAAASLPVVLVYVGAGAMNLVGLLAAWVLTCVWLMKARDNALLIYPRHRQRRGTAWLWLGWVVPIANLFVPLQVVGDVLRGSDRHERAPGERPRTRALLAAWWAAWLVGYVLSQIHSAVLDDVATGGTSAAAVTAIGVLGVAVTVAGLALWGVVLRRVVDYQARAEPG